MQAWNLNQTIAPQSNFAGQTMPPFFACFFRQSGRNSGEISGHINYPTTSIKHADKERQYGHPATIYIRSPVIRRGRPRVWGGTRVAAEARGPPSEGQTMCRKRKKMPYPMGRVPDVKEVIPLEVIYMFLPVPVMLTRKGGWFFLCSPEIGVRVGVPYLFMLWSRADLTRPLDQKREIVMWKRHSYSAFWFIGIV